MDIRLGSRGWVVVLVAGLMLMSCRSNSDSPQGRSTEAQADAATTARWSWAAIWSRQADTAKLAEDAQVLRGGRATSRVEQTAKSEWCLQPQSRADGKPAALAVGEGDVFEVSAWVKVEGAGRVSVSWVNADGADSALPGVWGGEFEHTYGPGMTYASKDWVQTRARFRSAGVRAVLPRLVGDNRATVWVDGLRITRTGNVSDVRASVPGTIRLENPALAVEIDTRSGGLTVLDPGTSKSWVQQPLGHEVVVTTRPPTGSGAQLSLLYVPLELKLQATIELVALDVDDQRARRFSVVQLFDVARRLDPRTGQGIDHEPAKIILADAANDAHLHSQPGHINRRVRRACSRQSTAAAARTGSIRRP